MEDSASDMRCTHCGKPIKVVLHPGLNLAVAEFPGNLLACFFQLGYGPTSVPCWRCGHANVVAQGAVWLGPDQRDGVLFLVDGELRRAAERAVAQSFGQTIDLDVVANDRRTYRRHVLQRYISPHTATLNDAHLGWKDPLDWVQSNEARIGYEFMAAMWLVLSGVVPLFGQSIDASTVAPAPNALLRRHEEVEDRITETGTREAVQQIANTVGDMLAFRLLIATDLVARGRSLAPLLEQIDRYAPRELLIEPAVAIKLADRVGDIVARHKIGEKGAIFVRYVVEAAHALLHRSAGSENRRRQEWTRILVAYEFLRRRDGNDDSCLLPAEIVRETVDDDQFWQQIRSFRQQLPPPNPAEPDSVAAHRDLADTVERIWPNGSAQLADDWIGPTDELDDEEALQRWLGLANDHALANPNLGPVGIKILARGMAIRRPGLFRRYAMLLFDVIEAHITTPVELLAYASELTELLNLYQHQPTALAIAERATHYIEAIGEPSKDESATVARFLNEQGNCYRYAARFDEALAAYSKAAAIYSGDAENRDWRIVERNRSIVLRSVGRLGEARAILSRLLQAADASERPGIVLSAAICWLNEGRRDKALALLERYESSLAARSLGEPNIAQYAMVLAQLRIAEGNTERGLPLLQQIMEWAEQIGAVSTAAATRAMLLDHRRDELDEAAYIAERQATIEALKRGLPHAGEVRGTPTLAAALAGRLADLLLEIGRIAEADRTLHRAVDDSPPESADTWILLLRRAEIARLMEDRERLLDLLSACLGSLQASIAVTAPLEDPYELLSDRDALLRRLSGHLLDSVETGWMGPAAARIAADIQASPVLTSRLGRRQVALDPVPLVSPYEDEAMAALLSNPPTTLIQTLETEDRVALAVTRLAAGEVRTEIVPLGIERAGVPPVLRRLTFHLARLSVDAPELDLSDVRGWQDLEQPLSAAADVADQGDILCVVPGVLGSLPFSLAMGERHSLAFVPSLGAAQQLRRRRQALDNGGRWRPRSIGDFAVWRAGDSESTALAMTGATEVLGQLCARHGVVFRPSVGADASADALMAALAEADLTRIACHGRLRSTGSGVDLLVAAEQTLPPSVIEASTSLETDGHLLNWERIAAAGRVSPLVISTACDSGAAVINQGGERLGLERPLLAAGAIALVAPQWPVGAVEMQAMSATLVEKLLDDTARPLADLVRDVATQAAALGVSPLSTRALGVFGDWS